MRFTRCFVLWYKEKDIACHYSSVSWLLDCKNVVMLSSYIEFSSKNFVLKFSIFSIGIGFNIQRDLFCIGSGDLASKWLCKRYRHIGKWSVLKSRLIFVAELYSLLLGVLM